jgi:hypothetical protein
MHAIYTQHATLPPWQEKYQTIYKGLKGKLFDVNDLRQPRIVHPIEGLLNYAYYDVKNTPHLHKILNSHKDLTFIFLISAEKNACGIGKPLQVNRF